GLSVAIDGEPIAAAALAGEVPVNPGAHTLSAEAPGYERRTLPFSAAERANVKLEIALSKRAQPRPPLPPPPPAPPPSSNQQGIRIAALITGGVAVTVGVALIAGSIAVDSSIDEQCGGSTRMLCPKSKKAEIESAVTSVSVLRFTGIA